MSIVADLVRYFYRKLKQVVNLEIRGNMDNFYFVRRIVFTTLQESNHSGEKNYP